MLSPPRSSLRPSPGAALDEQTTEGTFAGKLMV